MLYKDKKTFGVHVPPGSAGQVTQKNSSVMFLPVSSQKKKIDAPL